MASKARKETASSSREFRPGEGSRALPYPEYVRRREEGRCFHCGGAYGSREELKSDHLRKGGRKSSG